MRKKIGIMLCISMAIGMLSGCGVNMEIPEEQESEVIDLPPARAQDDFYRFINEETLADAEFEYGAMAAGGSFDSELTEDRIKDIIREVAAGSGYEPGSEEAIIKAAYDKYSAYDFENTPVPAELDALLHEIDEVGTVEEFLEVDAKLQREYGVGNVFNIAVDDNYLASGEKILTFCQYTGVVDVVFEVLEDSYASLNSLKNYGSAAMQAMGHDVEYSDNAGTAFGYIALDLFNKTDMEIAKAAMPFTYFNVYSSDQIKELLPGIDIEDYLTKMGVDKKHLDKFGIYDPEQLRYLGEILTEERLDALKAWDMVNLINKYRRFIVYGYDALEKYTTIDYSSDEDRILDEISGVFSGETDPIYVEKYYTQEMDDALIAMCDDIKEGYRHLIGDADWLSEETRAGLLEKLENIVYVTGADVVRHDNSVYKNITGKDYYEFYLSYTRQGIREMIDQLDEEFDRESVMMQMQILNACYNPSYNNINITVAIMLDPFFDINADYYTNLGGLGMVIAHEMGHAFDSNCILFNADGMYDPSWIAAEDYEKLLSRNEAAIRYFEDNFTIFGVYHVDGEQTLGENYADLGAMECISSLATTDEDRKALFTNFAKIWSEKRVDSALIDQIDSDEHSPAIIRVNAILSTLDVFYETYDVTEGDGMYIAPEDRISRWH